MSTKFEVATVENTVVVETSDSNQVTVVDTKPAQVKVVETPAKQGPKGRDGKDGADGSAISEKKLNRLTRQPDGLYVSDDLTPDPLAYYILSRS